MQRIFALFALLSIPTAELGPAPDLCADVYVDADGTPVTDDKGTMISRLCEPTGPEPPVWGQDVCCNFDDEDATCVPKKTESGCGRGLTLWCEYGELVEGRVICYQPFDEACAAGLCQAAYQPPAQESGELLCCNGPCVAFDPNHPMCDGELLYCWAPYQHESGVVECYGGEPF